ncbi:hypothetical protein N7471_009514 [Penicillium samsonianum]|uniref:uncharacterized protein n=1 Tax=Penicillium samsonianum TaxID=1882272 RepID=UPI0025482B5D|nr:uncharacterized protein N7471_009514 [Penicillium samsonianum]KAJ6128297.1 hypothetical protein N7471_009514 [Penicillium samsonianum]
MVWRKPGAAGPAPNVASRNMLLEDAEKKLEATKKELEEAKKRAGKGKEHAYQAGKGAWGIAEAQAKNALELPSGEHLPSTASASTSTSHKPSIHQWFSHWPQGVEILQGPYNGKSKAREQKQLGISAATQHLLRPHALPRAGRHH